MNFRLFGILVLTLLALNPILAATQNFRTLKHILSARSQEPKMYIPSGVVIGQNLEVTVIAPGSEYVKLLSSTEEGTKTYEDSELRLAGEIKEVGVSQDDRADFTLALEQDAYKDQIGKKVYFDALAYYKDNSGNTFSRPVSIYGANAGVSITNGVQILDLPKDSSSLAASARSFIPGLAGQRSNF